MDRKSPASPAVRARRRPAQRTEWRLAILGQTQHRHDGRQRPPALARRLGAGLAARRCRRPPSLRWRARGGPGCCCPGRSARWPRPPSPSSSFCSASMPAATTRISGGRCLIVAAGNAVAILRTHYRHGRRGYADRAALARQHAATAQATAGALFLAAGAARAAAGTGRHVAGHTGRRTGRPGRDRARHGIRGGLACACRSAACLAGLSRTGRRHASAGQRALTAGRRRLGTVVQRVLCAGRHRHQDGVAHARNAPPRRRSRALKPAPARRTAHRNSRRAQASPGIARTRPASAMHRIARRTDRPRPAPRRKRRRQARPGGVEDSGSDHRRIRSGRAGCRVNRSRDGCHGRLPTDASVCPCRTPNRLAALTCA